MKAVFHTYLQFVRAALRVGNSEKGVVSSEYRVQSSEHRVQSSEDEIGAVMALCERQGTGPLVYTDLLADEAWLDTMEVSAPLRLRMKQICVHTMQQQAHLQLTLRRVWDACEQHGVRAVLMKGAGLAVYYPTPQQRSWGDIDIFVGGEQYHAACAAMRATFPAALRFDEELDHYKHYNLIADGVSIEVHRVSMGLQHPVDVRRYARMEAIGMREAEEIEVDGLTIRVPEVTFNALMVMLHSWEHVLSQGASLRQLCDLALLLHHRALDIDREQLECDLCGLALMDVWQVYMYILVEYLGLPPSEAPFYTKASGCARRAEVLLVDMLEGRLGEEKQEKSKVSSNRWLRKWHTMRVRLRNAKRIRSYSPSYARHMAVTTWLHGFGRLLAKDRRWE